MEKSPQLSDANTPTIESRVSSEGVANTSEVMFMIRPLPAKSQAEMLQLLNGIRMVADCSIPFAGEEADQIIEDLRKSGFAVIEHSKKNGVMSYCVSRDPKLAEEAINTENMDEKRYAELMGFPATAIDAFVAGSDKLLSNKEQEKLLGFLNVFFPLRLSKEHYLEELEYLKKSYRLLLGQAPYLIGDVIHKDDAGNFMEAVTKFVTS